MNTKMPILTFATLPILATADNRSVDSTSTLDELVHSMDEVFQSADDLFQSWDDIHSMDEVCLSVDKFVRKWDKPVQTTNRAITLYEPSQPVNSALPMPHSGSSNAENPVPDADHEFNWARVFMGAWLGVVIVVTIFGSIVFAKPLRVLSTRTVLRHTALYRVTSDTTMHHI